MRNRTTSVAAVCAIGSALAGSLPGCVALPSRSGGEGTAMREAQPPRAELRQAGAFLASVIGQTSFEIVDQHVRLKHSEFQAHKLPPVSTQSLTLAASRDLKIKLLPGAEPKTPEEAFSRIEESLNAALDCELGPLPQLEKFEELRSLGCKLGSRKLLMSPPDHATRASEIADLHPENVANDLAVRAGLRFRWEALKRTFESLGASVEIRERGYEESTIRSVFTRDLGLLLPDYGLALCGHLDDERMLKERPIFQNWCGEAGFALKALDASFEGGNLVYQPGQKTVLVGVLMWGESEMKFSREYAQGFERELKAVAPELEVVALPSRVLHIDWKTSLTPTGHVFFLTNGLGPDAAEILHAKFSQKVHAISDAPASSMALNGVYIGRAFVTAETTPELTRAMSELGYQVVSPETLGLPLNSFDFLGGGPHCQTNDLR